MLAPAQAQPNRRGYTLIEMSVVVTIIALLALVVVPNFTAIRRSRAYFDLEASIIRTPTDAYNEARNSKRPVQIRFDGTSLVIERVIVDSDPEEVKRIELTSDIQVESVQLGSSSSDLSSWKWTVYPDGSADSAGVSFITGSSHKSLVLHKDGKSQWMDGDLPDSSDDKWQAGEIQKRG